MICSIAPLFLAFSLYVPRETCETFIPEIPRFEVDMTPENFYKYVIPASETLFGEKASKFQDPRAHALIISIALQESEFKARRQRLNYSREWWEFVKSPAVSYWQFEDIGIKEVLRNPVSRDEALAVLEIFGLPEDIPTIREALVYNDVLAAAWARLALWRHPERLPHKGEVHAAWNQYLSVWKPGRPHRHKWATNWAIAWQVVEKSYQ